MIKPLLLLAAAALTLSACAQPQPTRTVFISGPGGEHYSDRSDGRQRVIVIQHPRGVTVNARAHPDARRHAELARRHARHARRMALLAGPDPDEMARIRREALAAGEAGRRAGELARRRGEEIRRRAERLRAQCERGEIRCEIIVTD